MELTTYKSGGSPSSQSRISFFPSTSPRRIRPEGTNFLEFHFLTEDYLGFSNVGVMLKQFKTYPVFVLGVWWLDLLRFHVLM